MRLLVALLMACVAFAGCTSNEVPTESTAEPPTSQYVDDVRNLTVDSPILPTTPPAPGERTPLAAPLWRLGEWWVYEVHEKFTDKTWQFTRVVAGTEHGNYLVGFPIDAFDNGVMVLHTPGYGDVGSDLSYDAHDIPFTPLKWPLAEGNSWDTQWESAGATGTILVEEVRGNLVHLSMSPTSSNGPAGEIWYDADIGEMVILNMTGYADYKIVDHGFNYQGIVRVPHAHDLLFYHGRLGGVADVSQPLIPPTPKAPTDTVTIPDGYDRVSFAHIFLDLPGNTTGGQSGQQSNTGVYNVKATAPSGRVFESSFLPGPGASVYIEFFEEELPNGDWTIEAIAGGAGIAFMEGIGYHSIDVELPAGCVVAAFNANHHNVACDGSGAGAVIG